MIVVYEQNSSSSKNGRNTQHFESILLKTANSLSLKAKTKSEYYINRAGRDFEKDVCSELKRHSFGTPFQSKFKIISGQKFPDIIASLNKNNGYGIEVKTSKQNHWTTTGNSILEGSRVDHIQRIYIFFGKLYEPIEFRYRRYEECLYDVAVTHSPRYLIDMDSKNTIFDKINIPYDELRLKDNPIKPIKEYYRKNLKEGEALWWIDEQPEIANNLVVTPWSQLSSEQKNNMRNEGMALFPEIFGNRQNKFYRFGFWLLNKHSIFVPNVRDLYTSGGRVPLKVNGKTFNKIPRIFKPLQNNVPFIVDIIQNYNIEKLSFNWGVKVKPDRVKQWIKLVNENSKETLADSKIDIIELISERL